MRIRMKTHWRNYAPGEVTKELPDGVANTLIQRGIAEKLIGDGEVIGDYSWKAKDHPPRDKAIKRAQVTRK